MTTVVDATEGLDEAKAGSKLLRQAQKYRDNLDKRGVVYLSRIPPFMKPNKIRSILEPLGEITRLFLAEEPSESRMRRKQSGGNGSRQFKEGLVISHATKRETIYQILSLQVDWVRWQEDSSTDSWLIEQY